MFVVLFVVLFVGGPGAATLALYISLSAVCVFMFAGMCCVAVLCCAVLCCALLCMWCVCVRDARKHWSPAVPSLTAPRRAAGGHASRHERRAEGAQVCPLRVTPPTFASVRRALHEVFAEGGQARVFLRASRPSLNEIVYLARRSPPGIALRRRLTTTTTTTTTTNANANDNANANTSSNTNTITITNINNRRLPLFAAPRRRRRRPRPRDWARRARRRRQRRSNLLGRGRHPGECRLARRG